MSTKLREHNAGVFVAVGAVFCLLLALGRAIDPRDHVIAGRPLAVTMSDFRYSLSTPRIAPGYVTIHVHNAGPSTHEMIMAKTDLPADKLPLKPDGLTVNEHVLDEITTIELVHYDTRRTVTLKVAPGHYVFFCNLEGHYLNKMHAELVVAP
jgi:hypothetical protein